MATLKAMFKLYDGYTKTIDKINKKTDDTTNKLLKASGQTDKFNTKLEATGVSANKASSGLGKFLSVTAAIAATVKGMNIVDEYTNTAARLNLINDGLQTQAELQDKIFAAAERSRGSYSEMANAISKMGLLAGDAFSSNDELIAFTELVQKSFKVGGADTSEQMGAMRQLSQAMASGRLQGDELVSIMENAPMIYGAIAKYTGLTKGELKELSSDGAITADIIKNAMFMAGDDINAMFETMPMTFADVWTKIKNGGLKSFVPLIESVNNLINTEGFQTFLNMFLSGINGIASGLTWLINIFTEYWGIVGPVLSAIGGYLLANVIMKLWAMVAPLMAQGALWAMLTNPIFLVILAIGLVVAALNYMGVSTQEIIGFVCGAFWGAYSFIYNVVATLVNLFLSFSDFLGNLFIDPVAAIKVLFYDMAITILGYISSLATSLKEFVNLIPGVEMVTASGFEGIIEDLKNKRDGVASEKGFVSSTKWEFATAGSMFNDGYNTGLELANKGFDLSDSGTTNNPFVVEGVGSNGNVNVSMSDEDIKYLRDLAERDYINKFSTATLAPQLNVQFGDVRETADANQLLGILEKLLAEEIAVVSEG